MPSSIAYILWITCTLLEIFACTLIVIRGQFRQHVALWWYLALCVVGSALALQAFRAYGLASREYLDLYYYSDAAQTVALYFAVLEPYRKLFPEPQAQEAVRFAQIAGPIMLGVFSAAMVSTSGSHSIGRFAFEFAQLVGVFSAVFALVLFYPRLWDRRVPVHVYQLIFVMGAYFAFARSFYLLQRLHWPQGPHLQLPYGYLSLWISLGVAYAFSDPAASRERPQIRL
jgi:hypothetical protein